MRRRAFIAGLGGAAAWPANNCSTEVNDAPVSDWPCKMENQVST
jgi:hypothetical protein